MDDFTGYFDRVCVVNLDRRPDRRQEFFDGVPGDWPFKPPERIKALDGKKSFVPNFWKNGQGAWGCYRTHVRIIEDALNDGLDRVLLLEDDAVFRPDFTERAIRFLNALPDKWDMIYFGGQHLREAQGGPRRLNDNVYEPFNVNRTHAFAVSLQPSEEFGRTLYKWLHQFDDWRPQHHIDHHLGRLIQKRQHRVYCPDRWMVGQREGKSNINGRQFNNDRFWRGADKSSGAVTSSKEPFFAILGLHSSGSSALAGICYHLGLHLGNNLIGYYGNNPDTSCGFEAQGIMRICEDIAKVTDIVRQLPPRRIEEKLRWFCEQKKREAAKKGTRAGLKYPQLCVCGPELEIVLGDRLRIIIADRPIEESIASIERRFRRNPDVIPKLAAHQQWLWQEREQFVETLPAEHILRIDYGGMLENPRLTSETVSDFLGFERNEHHLETATSYVDPSRRHIKSTA